VGEDRHQRDGVWRQVLKLKPTVHQQHEEKGGERRHEPGQGIRREVDKVARLGERQHPVPHLRIIPRGLPPDRLPQRSEIALRLVARGGKAGRHGCKRWWTEDWKKRQNARQQETGVEREGRKEIVDPIYGFRPLYLLL
jgi:hypothetical protein